jgi:hypothetical protein
MDAQTLQKYCRLWKRGFAMGTLGFRWIGWLCVFGVLLSCARDLKNDEDLTTAPKEFDQEIADVSLEPSTTVEASKEAMAFGTSSVLGTPSKDSKTSKANKTKSLRDSKGSSNSKTTTSLNKNSQSEAALQSEAASTPPAQSLSKHWPIGVGEKLSLSMRWGVIEGGVVTMEVLPPKLINGITALHYRGEVKSSKVLNLFYKIDNSIDTWVSLDSLTPLRQEIKQLESARWGRRVMVIEDDKNKVKFYEHLTRSNGEVRETRREDFMSSGAQDLFGGLYFYRFVQHMSDGFRFPIHDRGKDWLAELRFVGKESLRVPAGTFQTRRYKVAPRLEGHLEPRGDVDVWLSDDERQVIVQFEAKIKVGSVTGELIEYVPGKKMEWPLPIWKTPVSAVATPGT